MVKHKVAAVLPNDYKSVHNAITQGTFISPECKVGRSIAEFAKRLAGGEELAAETPWPQSKLSSWLGR